MTIKKIKITKVDQEILALMPDGWFRCDDLPYPRVQRASYRCERLKSLGFLEWRVVGIIPNLHSEYRKIEAEKDASK